MQFKFPPPPPPPPKASPAGDFNPNAHGSHRGGHGHGRRDRGHVRGSLGRGRGYFGSAARGGHDVRDGTRSQQPRGGSTGGYQQNVGRGGSNHRSNSSFLPSRPYQQSTSQLEQVLQANDTPSSAYGHPPLLGSALNGNEAPQVDQNTLAQAMSFMATPAGMQSMAAFASHIATVNTDSRPPSTPMALSEFSKSQSTFSVSGYKRKMMERSLHHGSPQRMRSTQNAQQPSKKPARAKCNTAPEVPSFGFTLPPMPNALTASLPKPNASSHKQKPKVNLGLGHREATDESSDGEDFDEEATLAARYKVEGAIFEHNGESISLQTPAEVAAWIKDRRRHFPTQKRIIQKAEEEAVKRAAELEFLRKIKGQCATAATTQAEQTKRRKRKAQRPTHSHVDNKQLHQDDYKTGVEDGLSSTAPMPNPVDLGLGYASDTGSDSDDSSILSDSSVVSSTSESSDEADSNFQGADASEDDSDTLPESRFTKEPVPLVVVPPPQQTVQQTQLRKHDACASWQRYGKCKYGRHCRYPHPEEGDAKRVGLYERLVEQELEKTDQLALDAIKYLGRHGFLG